MLVAAIAVALLVGCGSSQDPQTAATPAAAPTPAGNDGREACVNMSKVGRALNVDPATNLEIGKLARESTNPDIAAQGRALADAATAVANGADKTEIMSAQVELAQACDRIFKGTTR
jgi:predicted outer membrane protein